MNMLKVKKSITLLVGMMTITALGGIAQAETRFAVQDPTGTTDKMVVTDQGYVGIGTNAPTMPFQIAISGTYLASTFEVRNTGNPTYYSRYTAPVFQMMRNNMPTDNNSIVKDLDRFGYLGFGTYFGSTAKYGAAVSAYAEGVPALDGSSVPGYLSFETTTSGNASPSEKLRISSTGNVGIGTQSPLQKLEINGGVRLNSSTSRPTCDATTRGTFWFNKAGVGSGDWVSVCVKNSSESYLWKTITMQ